jgi:lysozyme family protein
MESSWPLVAQWVIAVEGGDETADGHPTKWGITIEALSKFRGAPCTPQDVFDLTPAQAVEIYQQNYWSTTGAPALPWPADFLLFDAEVNEGHAEGVKHLQNAAKVTADGLLGPETITAIQHALTVHRDAFIEDALSYRGKFYADLAAAKPDPDEKFLRGWLARCFRLQSTILQGKVT